MKLRFKEENLKNYSFKDLEYGLVLIKEKRQISLEHICTEVLAGNGNGWALKNYAEETVKAIDLQIAVIENELCERTLTGNDDGMLEHTLLGG